MAQQDTPIEGTQDNTNAPAVDPSAPVVANGKQVKFFFKTETLRDEEGNEIGKGRKHPDVEAILPMPTVEQVLQELSQEGPVRKLIMDALEEQVTLAARMQINDWRDKNPEGTFTATLFDLSKLDLRTIALTPKKDRGGWAPSEQDIKDFVEDYKHVMVHVVGYDAKKVGTHCKNFEKGLTKIRTEKPILAKVKELLTMWASRSEQVEENQQIYDWYVARIDKWLKAEEKNTADAF